MEDDLTLNEQQLATRQWQRYVYCRDRGHTNFITQAKRCEQMYMGAGRMWTQKDREQCEEVQGRKCVEVNTIFTTINTVCGEQIQTRADFTFKPRAGDATQEIADDLTKLTMQIGDDNDYPYLESEVWADGIIQQRGYFDIRMDFDDNLVGDIRIGVLDPLEVIPDPDAQSYDPKHWADVTITRFMSVDEIEQTYGKEAADKVSANPLPEVDFGVDESGADDAHRNRFGDTGRPAAIYDTSIMDKTTKMYRVLDRQHRRRERQQFYLNKNSDLRPVPMGYTKEQIDKQIADGEWILTYKVAPRVRWTVTTINAVLHDDWSPYPHLTIVPFFPYFRRGKTLGLVDNAISPAETQNKAFANLLHVINSTANSGWIVEEDSLSNMETEDLAEKGMKTGLVVEYSRGRAKPEKIVPNPMPPGYSSVVTMAGNYIKAVTGVNPTDDEIANQEESGVAYEGKKFQEKIHLAVPLSNLARSRKMIAKIMLNLIQTYYTEERIIMITQPDEMGENKHVPMTINKRTSAGEILNDLTLGEYGVIVSDVPHAASFQTTQFREMMDMKKYGVAIPDTAVVQVSSLAKKKELIEQMNNVDPELAQLQKELQRKDVEVQTATAALKTAQAEKARSGVVLDGVTALYEGVQAAQVAATIPALIPVADELLKSAGFIDKNPAPIFPAPVAPVLGMLPTPVNTHPALPPGPESPAVGLARGIETPQFDGVRGGQNGNG